MLVSLCASLNEKQVRYSSGFFERKGIQTRFTTMPLRLGPWGKILVLGLGATVVVLAILIVACFVGPGCWGYEWLNRDENRKRKRMRDKLQNGSVVEEVKLDNIASYRSFKRDSSLYSGTIGSTSSGTRSSLLGRLSHRDSTYSSMSEATDSTSTVSGSSLKSILTPNGESTRKKDNAGEMTFTLQYLSHEDSLSSKLLIGVKDAKQLPFRDYLGSVDPFVLVQLIRTRWCLNGKKAHVPLFEWRTRTVRHTVNPDFNQIFGFMADSRGSEIKEWSLRLTVFDQDKFANPIEIGQLNVPLKDIKQLITTNDQIVLTRNLTYVQKELGEILFGISYLPTAQRLSFSVIKATNLNYMEIVESLDDFNPYIRVVMMNSTGRIVKKKKTTFKRGTDTPVFNETLTFDLLNTQLETTKYRVLLCSKTIEDSPQSCKSERGMYESNSSLESPSGDSAKKYRDKCLGKLALGKHVRGEKEYEHWLSMMESPRKVISQWHSLK